MIRHRSVAIAICALIVLGFLSIFCSHGKYAKDRGRGSFSIGALFVVMDVSLSYRNGEVVAIAENRLTVLPGVVATSVYLYSFKGESYKVNDKLSLVAQCSVSDLDFTESISVSHPLTDEAEYWLAAVRYTVDGSAVKMLYTEVLRYDLNGNVIERNGADIFDEALSPAC